MDSTQSHNLALSKKAFEAVSPKLDDETRAQSHEFIYEANEWGLGVELLIDFLMEEGVTLTKEQFLPLSRAASSMQIDRGLEMVEVSG